jgi:hypothetical protein
MFDKWRERRRLKREIASIERRYQSKLRVATEEDRENLESERESELVSPQMLLEIIDYEVLVGKAQRLGLDPRQVDSSSHGGGMSTTNPRLRKLIRDERLSIAGHWVKILVPVLTVLVSLLGLLVALVTVLRK